MNTTGSITKFIIRSLMAAIPLALLLIAYVMLDPFKVVYNTNPAISPHGTILPFNKGLISIRAYDNNRSHLHYNAYILGSSRTIYYRADDWATHLPDDATIIHMDASGETTEGILLKLQYIESAGDSIKYALIEFAPWAFTTKESDTTPFRTPCQLTGRSEVVFQWKYFHDFLQRDFIKTYAMYLITGQPIERSNHKVFLYEYFNYEAETNECINDSIEKILDTAPMQFFASRYTNDEFALEFSRDSIPPTLPTAIDSTQREMLAEIKSIFNRHNTDYQIIIGPDWNRDNISPSDLKTLTDIFGDNRVHNLSQWQAVTDSVRNFYDHTHYRPPVAKAILDSIYRK